MAVVPGRESEIANMVRTIAERFSPQKIILFGSEARGDASADSDVDFLVLFDQVDDIHRRTTDIYIALRSSRLPTDIIVSTISRFDRFKDVVNTIYWPAAREGRVVYEHAT